MTRTVPAAAGADGPCCRPSHHLSREEKRKEYDIDPTRPREMWRGLRDEVIGLSDQYFNHHLCVGQVDERLHDLWDELIHIAKVTPADSAEHDRLVTLVLEARELGSFARKIVENGEDRQEEAVLPDGQRLWSDLPFLVQALQDFWTKESMALVSTERESLSVLTAKLCAVGVCPAELSRCALWLFKETLETERPLVHLQGAMSGGDSKDSSSHPSIADLLPACLAWLRYNNFKLAKLSVANDNHDPASGISTDRVFTTPGDLASDANVTQDGFSVARWLFWRRRFNELHRAANATDNTGTVDLNQQVAKLTRACFEEAVLTGLHVGLDIPGEKKYLENLFEALDHELIARGLTQCVGPEDIEIDMNWAEEN